MKRLIIFFLIPLSFVIAACSPYMYKSTIRPSDLKDGKLDPAYGYIYGVYTYVVRNPVFFANEPYIVLDLIPKSRDNRTELFIGLGEDQGYFLANLIPGDYTLHRIILNVEGQDYSFVTVDKDFTVGPGTVFYVGNIKTEFVYNTQPFIWWGIRSIDDQFQGDTSGLVKDFAGITAANLVNGFSTLGSVIQPFEKKDFFEKGGSRQLHAGGASMHKQG